MVFYCYKGVYAIWKSQLQSFIRQVDDRQEELIQLLKELISFKTPAPPARNTEEAQQFCRFLFRRKRISN